MGPLLAGAPDVGATDGGEAPELEVPFGCGRTFPVSQAHQTGSHQHKDAFAWDFRMPEGEPIVAARDGVVRLARGDSSVGACDVRLAAEANFVVVAHEGGLETQYLHFSKVVVKPGDAVKAGDLLGYSGRTGWACGAHLHFKVARTGSSWNNDSVPARLVGHGDAQVSQLVRAPRCTPERPYLASLPRQDASKAVAASLERPDAGVGSASPPVPAAR
ncbi:MAG: M23 family metallopeptidase [Myxococcota bacterium]